MKHERTLLRPAVVIAVVAAAAAVALTAVLGSIASGSGASAPAADRAHPTLVREVPRFRNRYSKTFETDAGTYLTRSYAGPVNYRDDGEWKTIDASLVRSTTPGYAYENEKDSYSLQLPESLDAKPVRVSSGADWVSFALHGASGARAATAAGMAGYGNALPSVDVNYEAQAGRAKEALVLRGPKAQREFTFEVQVSGGLRARTGDAGGIDFVDGDGVARLAFAPPSMSDASGESSTDVSMALSDTASGYEVTVTADDAWLDAKDRKYPVTVDPTTTSPEPSDDCYMVGGTQANSNFCGYSWNWEDLGTDASANPRRPFEKYDLSAVPKDAEVLEGQLHIHPEDGSQREVDLHHLLHSSTTARTWNKYDGTNAWAQPGGEIPSTPDGKNTAVGNGSAGWYVIEARKLVQGWVDGSTANHGLILKDVGGSGLMHVSAEETSNSPFLEVEWHARTGVQGRWTFEDQRLSDRMLLKTNVANGNLILEESDVHVPGTAGHDLDFKRYYNSRETDVDVGGPDDLGRYWRMSTGYDVWLKFDGGDTTANFNGPSGFWAPYDKKDDGTYETPTGMNADLRNVGGTYKLNYRQSDQELNFNSSGALTTVKDRNDNTISFAYSGPSAKMSAIKDTHDQGTANNTLTLSYNGSGWLSTVTDRANPQRTWQYGYTGNLLTTYTNPDGKVTLYAYDASENLIDITDPRGNVTHMTYDTSKRVKTIRRWTDAAHTTGPLTQYSYPTSLDSDCSSESKAKGETVETDPNGHTIKYCWDELQRVVKTVDGRGKSRKKGYTGHSDVNSVTSAGGQAWALGFDGSDRATGSTAPGSGSMGPLSTTIGYDAAVTDKSNPKFWLASDSTDTQGNSYTYEHDDDGNLTKVIDGLPSNNTITIAPTANGTPDTITDPGGGVTDYGYNSDGDLTSIDRPGTALGTESTTYDPAHPHTPKTHTDGRGKVATYTYDALDRVQQISYSDGTWVAYAYDEDGNITTRLDATGVTTYEYDPLNRLQKETFPGGQVNAYLYDDVGNLLFLVDASGWTGYTYGPSNLLDSMGAPGDSATTTYTYTDDNQRKTTTYPNGVVMTATWEDGSAGNTGPGRLKRIKAVKGATTITNYGYTYNKTATVDTGLRRTMTDKSGATATFDYDPLNRLKTATNADGHDYSFTYDGRGNVLTKVRDGVTTSHGYNLANELCWTVGGSQPDYDCTPAPSGATVYSADTAGNMTSGGTFSATYNAKEQTTAMSGVSGEASIGLAHANTNQFERATAGSKTFINNALGVGYETTGSTNTYYRRDTGGGLQSERLPSGAVYYYVFDGLGSVRALTDSNGIAQNTYSYEPYGITGIIGSVYNPWQFASGYHDSTNWYKYGMRYYSARLGRWSQLDPLERPTDPRHQNRFVYAGNDPVNTIDASGAGPLLWAADPTAGAATRSGSVLASALTFQYSDPCSEPMLATPCHSDFLDEEPPVVPLPDMPGPTPSPGWGPIPVPAPVPVPVP